MTYLRLLLLSLALVAVSADARGATDSVITYKTTPVVQATAQPLNVDVVVRISGLSYYRAIVFEIDYARGGAGAATDVRMACKSCRVADGLACTAPNTGKRDIHVAVSTDAATGVTTTLPAIWRTPVSGPASWTWEVTNLPSDALVCTFSATAGALDDTLTVATRLVTP